mmetsp:Transcript_12673/g.29238  ORF Transcript_12673/g.29238 Transcript_12673/m.29238 type:complete len:157 (+) Transcript_12673:570-1040(+)
MIFYTNLETHEFLLLQNSACLDLLRSSGPRRTVCCKATGEKGRIGTTAFVAFVVMVRPECPPKKGSKICVERKRNQKKKTGGCGRRDGPRGRNGQTGNGGGRKTTDCTTGTSYQLHIDDSSRDAIGLTLREKLLFSDSVRIARNTIRIIAARCVLF